MGNLSNLYVSRSFQSLIHLATDNTASANLIGLQDGYGNSIGAAVNTAGDLSLSGSFTASLQNGYVWVGNASGKTTTVATSSFGGGGTINTSSFATTGSNTFNGSQNIVGAVTASTARIANLNYPTADNGAKSFIQTDGAGNLSLQYVDAMFETVRNMSGVALDKGTPVYISGSTGDNGNAYVADASDVNKMPAMYILGEDLGIGATGIALVSGLIEGVDTTGYSAGTEIYVAEGGGWSDVRPSGSASIVQKLGVVTKEGVGGQGVVINQLEAELPNLQTGYAWVGNVSNQPVQVATSSFGGGGAGFPYVGDAQISGSLGVTGSVNGFVNTLTIGSNTASMNFNDGNFFRLQLVSGSITHLTAANIKAGQTINLLVLTDSGSASATGSLTFSPEFKFAGGFDYTPTAITASQDLVSFVTFDTTQILAASIKNLL